MGPGRRSIRRHRASDGFRPRRRRGRASAATGSIRAIHRHAKSRHIRSRQGKKVAERRARPQGLIVGTGQSHPGSGAGMLLVAATALTATRRSIGRGRAARAELRFGEGVQRLHGVEPPVQILGLGVEIEQAGDDLARVLALLQDTSWPPACSSDRSRREACAVAGPSRRAA